MRQLFRCAVQLLLICTTLTLAAQSNELVLRGGRVIDPETGLDGVPVTVRGKLQPGRAPGRAIVLDK